MPDEQEMDSPRIHISKKQSPNPFSIKQLPKNIVSEPKDKAPAVMQTEDDWELIDKEELLVGNINQAESLKKPSFVKENRTVLQKPLLPQRLIQPTSTNKSQAIKQKFSLFGSKLTNYIKKLNEPNP